MKTIKAFVVMALMVHLFFGCKKEYSYERGPAELIATGSLLSNVGECRPITINGQYKPGGTLGDNNYVTVQVHFTSPGRYKIQTNIQNGFFFRDSGLVEDTGYKNIQLKATGKPILADTTNFLIAFDTSYCSFSIPFTVTAVPPAITDINRSDSAWQFSQGTQFYRGFFDGALTHVLNGSTIITLVGLTPTKDSAIAIIINMASLPIVTGSYKSPVGASFIFFSSGGKDIYTADKPITGGELTVTITKYDATTRIIEGTFDGTVLNSVNAAVPLTAGKFKAKLTQ